MGEKQNAIVTGGAGFIGSHVVDALLERDYHVEIIDNLSTGKRENIPAEAVLHELDIRSPEVNAIFERLRPRLMFHLAAQMDVRVSVEDPGLDADVNIRGLLNLLEAGRKNGLQQVVFSSTGGAIYGEQKRYPADEEHPVWPVSPYGIAKLASEKYLFYYHVQYGLNVSCLRYANVYGPRQNPHGEAGVVAIFSGRLLRGEKATIFGDGEITRDYVYAGDVVAANMAVVGRPGFEYFNVGTGRETTVNALYSELARITGTDLEPNYAPPRAGEQLRSSITSRKLAESTGVAPKVDLSEGLEKTVAWFRDNRDI